VCWSSTPRSTPSLLRSSISIPDAYFNANGTAAARRLVHEHLEHIPEGERPSSLRDLVAQLEATPLTELPPRTVALCHVDANTLNFIRRPRGWLCVDWENSGWGDTSFEIAEIMSHPGYMGVPISRWPWVRDTYCSLSRQTCEPERIQTYYRVLLVYWVVRVARYLYETPRGLDVRLAERREGWEEKLRGQYRHYLDLARAML